MAGTAYGRYHLLRKIAAGGMGEIFLAREWAEGGFFRDLVVKRLFSHLSEHETALRAFQYEARLMAELRHPNIPYVTELCQIEGTWCIAMEYVDGQTIADLWRAGARAGVSMPRSVVVAVAMQICEALHHAHERRDRAGDWLAIVHRDVTPQNVMVTRDGVVKLMDFGVAQTSANVDEPGTVKGTYSYMSPEQVRGQRLDRRSDVFALGVILYELTTGTRLFHGNEIEIMTAVVEATIPPPTTVIPEYPKDLEAIVMAALRRDPEHRIASAADLALHLESFALRQGMLVGPRAIAHFVETVSPRATIPERALGMVEAPIELSRPKSVPPSAQARGASDALRPSAPEAAPPVVLLDQPKSGQEDEYLRALRRRLEPDA